MRDGVRVRERKGAWGRLPPSSSHEGMRKGERANEGGSEGKIRGAFLLFSIHDRREGGKRRNEEERRKRETKTET